MYPVSFTNTKATMCVVQLHLEVNSESSYVARALQICPGDVKS